MPRRKLERFAQIREWNHVLETPLDVAGTWGPRVILELGCGSGDLALELAARDPLAQVVGVEIKGARLWQGAHAALQRGLENVRFLRVQIEELDRYFAPGEVDELWITFPDPYPTKGGAKKRLTSPRFLEMYRRVLKDGGRIYLKTDNELLFEYSAESLRAAGFEEVCVVRDLYGAGEGASAGDLTFAREAQTAYERRYLKEGRVVRWGEWRNQ